MISITHTDTAFTHLITLQIPAIARVPMVRDLMKKYTSGYLSEKRLAEVMKVSTLPLIGLKTFAPEDAAASGNQSGDLISLDSADFEGYKMRESAALSRTPITVLHELAHWGYRTGQRLGNASDSFGRQHNNHGDYKSPLNVELEKVFAILAILSRPAMP